MPQATLEAMSEHGQVRGDTVRGHYGHAQQVLADLAALGIDYNDVVEVLEREGVEKFDASWNSLIDSISEQLEDQGASVSATGSTTPAGQGPATGDKKESRQ